MNNEPLHIISLGAGVQSSTMALMAAAGEIKPMPVAAIFADTQIEPKKIYKWIELIKKHFPFPLFKLTRGNLMDDSTKVHTSKKSGRTYIKGMIPAFLLQPNGAKGLLGRICTVDYKINVVIKKIKELIGGKKISEWRLKHKLALKALSLWSAEMARIKKQNKGLPKEQRLPFPMRPEWAWSECQADALAVSWIGISYDEAHRIKESRVPWLRQRWPLVEMKISRDGCLAWMAKNGFPEPPRSACRNCPFHSDDEWIRLRDFEPEEFALAVEDEKKLQAAAKNQTALTGMPYLHSSCVPLDQVNFVPTKKGMSQISLFGNECEGMCGV